MMSSSSATSDPAHPEPAQDQAATIDSSHPQQECTAGNEEIADQCQQGDAKPDDHEDAAEPQTGDTIEQHEIDRPEGAHLARPEMAEHGARQHAEREKKD